MIIKFACFLIVCGFPLLIYSQQRIIGDCNKVKYGTFYFYPENVPDGFKIIRENKVQIEINLNTKDTTFWEISWKDACEFRLKFIRKSRLISVDEKIFYNSHVSVVKLLKVAERYYIFRGALDSLNNKSAIIDTLWFRSRIN